MVIILSVCLNKNYLISFSLFDLIYKNNKISEFGIIISFSINKVLDKNNTLDE